MLPTPKTRSNETLNRKKKYSSFMIDRDPFYKHTVLILRDALVLTADIVTFQIFPIMLTLFCLLLFSIFFREKYYYAQLINYGDFEFVIILAADFLWELISLILLKLKCYKFRSFLSKVLSVIVFTLTTFFLMEWFRTPGTNFSLNMDIITFYFVFWNYFGFGISTILFSVPILSRNIFVILFSMQICFFISCLFKKSHIVLITLYQAIWELIGSNLSPPSDDVSYYKRGLYFSHFKIKKDQIIEPESATSHISESYGSEDSNVVEIDYKKKLFINESNVTQAISSLHTFKLKKRPETTEIPKKVDNLEEFHLNKEYGPDAMLKLEKTCERLMAEGTHISFDSIIFYTFVLIDAVDDKNYVGLFFIFQIIGFGLIIKTVLKIFSNKQVPTMLLVLVIATIASNLIIEVVSPCFKHIVFAGIGSVELIHKKFST